MEDKKRRFFLPVVCLLAAIALLGCGGEEETHNHSTNGDHGNGTGTAGEVAKLVIVGQAGVAILPEGVVELPKEVTVGTPVVLGIVAYDKAGKVITGDELVAVYSGVSWKSSDESVASILFNPATAGAVLLTTKKPGKVKITASYKGISATVELVVK